ncbi:cell cycle control protein [Phanerochaete sordida]|uniref:Cell cycle control protein n=1 Tax=Phanerochaete sordida TaxID=48140 RepID=A0A9P3G372_9APHY|nr:cell cycle control protein [Phanerochaete sordida]
MALFRRNRGRTDGDQAQDEQPKKEKGNWRKPANTAFKQQRLKAWQPILTPKTVLPTLLIIGIIFAPVGGLLIWGSGLVTEITLDYTLCENQTASASNTSLNFVEMPHYNYRLRAGHAHAPFSPPQFAFVNDPSAPVGMTQQCYMQFDIPYDLDPTVLLYYKMTNFFQNHRRYVKSIDMNQLKGDFVSNSDLNSGDCKPITTEGDGSDQKAIYPCGLIANSVFNDTYSNLTSATAGNGATSYIWSEKGIAWPGEAKKYASTPGYDINDIAPPPNWRVRFPAYNSSIPPPNLKEDEHFQNWMRTAGLPTFTKLWGRNDNDKLPQGRYQIVAYLNYPVQSYRGTKSVVITTVSWIGGKNPFLGWAYVATAALFVALAVAGTIRHMIRPRKAGDMSLLSWNR